jgi:hypothetical protein
VDRLISPPGRFPGDEGVDAVGCDDHVSEHFFVSANDADNFFLLEGFFDLML